MKLKNTLFQFIVALMLLTVTTPVMAQYLKPGDIIYENDALEGTTPQGVVFWVDSTGYGGWIVSLKDQSTGSEWSADPHDIPASDITITTDINTALADTAGWINTEAILNKYPTDGSNHYAVNKVDFANGWYLPAAGQLNILYSALPEVNETLGGLGSPLADKMTTHVYWSSTAYNNSAAWAVNFGYGNVGYNYVDFNLSVRSVRAFNSLNYLIHSGRVAVSGNADSEITNNIVYGNKDKNNGEANLTSSGTVSYTAVETTAPSGIGNKAVAAPDFAAYTGDNYRLAITSALIDSGDNTLVPTNLTTDLDGNKRKCNAVDPGAYETKLKPVITVTTPQNATYTGEKLYITPGTTTSNTLLEYKYINRAAPADTLTAAINAGEYDVLVISPSIGDFAEDSIKVPFTVKKDSIILELTAKNTGYTGSPVAIDTPVIRGGTAATDLAGTLQIQYDGNPTPPTAPGSYTVTATINGDNNHIGTTATTTLTITAGGASLFMADKTVVYDDAPQSVKAFSNPAGLSFTYSYEGTLSDGTSYGPLPTPPTNAGTYSVTASFAGNSEYVAGSVQARLTIEKAPVTVYVGSQTLINGKPIREEATVIDAKGKVVPGTMSYAYKGIGATPYPGPAQPANTATGTYQVTVAFAGDNNYLPATGTGILTILLSGSPYPGIYLRDTVVVFGHSYTMKAITEPATGLSPTTYTYSGTRWDGTAYTASKNAPTAAGRYTVKAVSGIDGTYTQSSTTTANLIIQKAPQTIDMSQAQFDGKNELNIGDVIPVIATASSLCSSSPITLTSSDPSVASFGSGPNIVKLTIHSAGSTLIKAEKAGDNDYEAAAPVYRLLYVKGGKVTIENPLHVNGHSDPSEITLCDADSYDLSLTAKGDILDYTWYRNGVSLGTTNDSICTITESGAYTVDVNGVLDTVSSGPVTVRFSSSPVITKNLQDASIVGGSVILTVEATGPALAYQWYFNNQIITGANTESLKVREEGVYYVRVSNECGSESSVTARVTCQIVDPIIKRRIDLPQVEGIVTTPSAGIHYVESRADFFFYMSATEGYSLDEVTVSTNRDNEVLLEPTNDGRIKVTIKHVNAAITIRIEGVRHGVDNAFVPESKVWASNGVVYFSLPAATDVSVYTLTGSLYERRRLPAGDSRLPMPAGVYIITLETGLRQKIVIP